MKDLLEQTTAELDLQRVQSHLRWWEKKRITFNIVLLIAGIIPCILNGSLIHFPLLTILAILAYGIAANLCYCAGWGLGLILWNYMKNIDLLDRYNKSLFALGLSFSTLLTFSASFFFYPKLF